MRHRSVHRLSIVASASLALSLSCGTEARADEPTAQATAPAQTTAPAQATAPAPEVLVLVLDENGLHPADPASLGAPKKKPKLSAAERGAAAARVGLPPRRDAEPRPLHLEWEPGEVVPFGYKPESQPSSGFRSAGIATFSASAGVSVLAAILSLTSDGDLGPLAIPVAGPLITIGTANSDGGGTFVLVADTLTQLTGIALFTMAWVDDDTHLRRMGPPPPRAKVFAGATSTGLEVTF